MISPHAIARERVIFTLNLDAERARRWAGLPEPERHPHDARRPMAKQRLVDRVHGMVRQAIRATVFTGG